MINAFGISKGSVVEQLSESRTIQTDWLFSGSIIPGLSINRMARAASSNKSGLLSTYKSGATTKIQAPVIKPTSNTGSYIEVNNLTDYNLTGDMTVAFDYNLDPAAGRPRLNPIQTLYTNEFAVTVEPGNTISLYRGKADGTTYQAVDLAANQVPGVMQSVMITCNHTTGTVKCYVDGVLTDTKLYSPTVIATKNVTKIKLLTGYCNETFRGILRNVRLWERELSASEAKLNVFAPPDLDDHTLVLWYPLDAETFEKNRDMGPRRLPSTYVNPIAPIKVDMPLIIRQSFLRQYNRIKYPTFSHASWIKDYNKNTRYNVVTPPSHLLGTEVITFNTGNLVANLGYLYNYSDVAKQLYDEVLTPSVWVKVTNTAGATATVGCYNADNTEATDGQRVFQSLPLTEADGWKLMQFPYITANDNYQDSLSFNITCADTVEVSMCAPMLERGDGQAHRGLFATNSLAINQVHSAKRLVVRPIDVRGSWAKAYTIKCYDASGTVVKTFTETNAVAGDNYYVFDQEYNLVAYDLIITDTSIAGGLVYMDAFFEDFTFTRSDSLKPKADQQFSLMALQLFSNDTLLPKGVDAENDTLVSFDKTDTVSTTLSHVSFIPYLEKYSAETITSMVNEAELDTNVSFTRTDILSSTAADAELDTNVSFTRSDIVLHKVTDQWNNLEVQTTRTDILLPKGIDSWNNLTASIDKSDILLPKGIDAELDTNVSFTRTDVLNPKAIDAWGNLIASILKTDSLVLHRIPEIDGLQANLDEADNLIIRWDEKSYMTNIHTKMSDAARSIKGKIEIFYSDPTINDFIEIEVSEKDNNSNPNQLFNGLAADPKKWLQANKSGTNYSYVVGRDAEVGWWGTTISDANGVLSPAPQLTLNFNKRAITELKFIGVANYDSYPVDFSYAFYNETGGLIKTLSYTGNNNVIFSTPVESIPDVAKIVMTITKISQPFDAVKLSDVFSILYQTYEDDMLLNFSLLEDLDYPTDTKTLGTITSNELRATLSNADRRFDPTNLVSPLSGYLKKNRKVKASIGVEIIPGQTEWYPLGVFWTTGWSVPVGGMEASFSARDILEVLRTSDYLGTQVLTNVSLGHMFELVLQDFGMAAEDYSIEASLFNINLPYAWTNKGTHLEALRFLAGCADIKINVDRYGKLLISSMAPQAQPMYVFDEDADVFGKSYPAALMPEVNCVEVIAQTYSLGTQEDAIRMGSAIVIAANSSQSFTLQYTQPPYMNFSSVVSNNANVVISQVSNFAWGVMLTLTNNTGTLQSVILSQNAQKLNAAPAFSLISRNEASIKEQGLTRIEIKSPLIQSNQYAQELSVHLLSKLGAAKYDVSLDTRGHATLVPGDYVGFKSIDRPMGHYQIRRQTVKYDGTLSAIIEGTKI